MDWKVLLLVFLFIGCTEQPEKTRVGRVIDGDTLELENGSKVRLNGINTPEKGERLWDEARIELLWVEGSEVRLERDIERKDRYGRLLMYVYSDGEMINQRLVAKGLAHVYRTKNRMHLDVLLEEEKKAREKQLGIWEESEEGCVELLELDAEEEYFVIENKCPYKVNISYWKVKDEATNSLEFPEFMLEANALLTVHSGKGISNITDLYWGKGNVWNNDYDRLFLRDSDGLLVAFEEY